MSSTRRRARGSGRWLRMADGLDRFGQRGLLAIWWLVASAVRLVALAADRAGAALGRSFRPRQLVATAALFALVAAALVFAWRWYRASEDRPHDDVEALARVIRSEIGTGPLQHRLHVAWATRNLATERGQSIVEMACSPCGPQDRSRPVSSRQRATDADRELARQVLAAPCQLDPTGGATHFIDPLLQDQLARAGAPGYAGNPYASVARRWRASYGWDPYYRLGATLEMWGPARRGRTPRLPRTCSNGT